MTHGYYLHLRWLVCLCPFLVGCRELGLVEGTPRQRYERALIRAHLDQTALGRAWLEVGSEMLAQPVPVSLPFSETGYFPPEVPRASGYRFSVSRGQRVLVHLQLTSNEPVQVFLELFSAVDSNRAPEHLVSADSGETGIDVEIEDSGEYLVRLQPELLRSIRYTITIRHSPVLGFPVEGAGNEAIRSQYGVDRDGGRRRHEGIDIFAARGTPVLAPTRGRVVNVGDNRLGGLVIWVHDDDRNQNLYFAHLDRQLAVEGQRVEPGDTIGLVGNTGNARTTPPHLHFGIYRRGQGSIDPFPYVYRTATRAPVIETDTGRVGTWVRVTTRRTPLTRPQLGPDTLETATVMRVIAATGTRYRVELPDKRTGFIAGRAVQSALDPLSRRALPGGGRILERPLPEAIMVDTLLPRATVDVLGRFGEFQLVQVPDRSLGWLRR